MVHRPVMLREMLELLEPRPGQTIVDATLGAGGHAEALLEAMMGQGMVLGIDRDEAAMKLAGDRLARWGEAFKAWKANFADLPGVFHEQGLARVDGLVADLGLSSMQLAEASRGFSFRLDGPLDMRMDRSLEFCAADLLNRLSPEALERVFREQGEERYARRVARMVVERRRRSPWRTTLELVEALERVMPGRRGRIHPATRVFQALRIATNGELENLDRLCRGASDLLRPGGVFVCVSYHSLEDRIVKEHLREGTLWEKLTQKPLRPAADEVAQNPRSRSAKLRAARRR